MDRFPLFGALQLCRKNDHFAAIREVCWSLLIAFLPILLLLFIYLLFSMPLGFTDRLTQFAKDGDLLLLSAAIIAPLCYMALRNYFPNTEEAAEFPHKHAFLIAYIVIVLMCTAAFVMIDLSEAFELQLARTPLFHFLSYFAVILSVILVYLSTVYRNAISGESARFMTEATEDFVSKWRNFNG